MQWSYTLGRFFGIRVQLHLTFLLLLGWVALTALLDGGSFGAVIGSVLFMLALFGFVVMHEYGHALTARAFGIRTREITLYPIGGVAMLERMPQSPKQQLLVALAGPAVNFVLAGAIAVLMALLDTAPTRFGDFGSAASLLSTLFWVNVVMGGFNLLPALPMDGGRVLRALLAMRLSPLRATQIAARVAKVMALGMAGYAVYEGQLMLLLIAGVVWFMSSAESRVAEASARREGPDTAGDDPIRVRAYPTDAFRARGFDGAPDREEPEPGRGFEVTVMRGADGRIVRILRVRRA